MRTFDAASTVPAPMIYVAHYLALIVAYASVIKYMAEKPAEQMAALDEVQAQGKAVA